MTVARLVLIVALVAGISFIGSWFLPLPPPVPVVWKGAGVALLALYAGLRARDTDGWLLAVVLAFGALGDVLLETHGLVIGALAFLAGHIVATVLYLRNRDRTLSRIETLAALALIPLITVTAYFLPPDRAGAGLIALYALGLAIMTATAALSRFPKLWVALGALMFTVSDLLIFLRTGRPELDILPMGLAVWGLYFGGQALIAVGASRVLGAATSR